ncbi:MAG: hypothetical protein DHS20C18_24240 [Saprospiraceae bacterium]|nr:MAG: hypothetical protein DHS20C18_24240 [Saprospiraceae bacterium]
MKNWLTIILVTLSLAGLGFIQYRLLQVGVILEKERFDQRMESALSEFDRQLNQADYSRHQIVQLHYVKENAPTDSLVLEDSIRQLLGQIFERADIQVDYTFAFIDRTPDNDTLFASANFQSEHFRYERFALLLKGDIRKECHCNLYFHVNINQLFNYLLRQLAYLIIPSILFVGLLATGMILLIVNLNRQKRLDQVKNDFINNLTHELKTPVFSISILTKLLRQSTAAPPNSKTTEYLTLLEKENNKVKKHVENVLELASMESGHYQLDRQPLDLHHLIRQITGPYAVKLLAKGGHLQLDLSAVNYEICADATHLENVLQNLLENALKYNKNKPKITVKTKTEGSTLLLSIIDNGVGIAPEHQQKIFDKFYRVSPGDLHEVKGFGLGLSYVRHIIRAHDGQIEVISRLEQGAEFTIKLPLAKQEKSNRS